MAQRDASSELVGREEELGLLLETLEVAAGRSPATVLVGGEAGIGKTRLIKEACARAKTLGYLTAVGACLTVEGRVLANACLMSLLRDLERQLQGRSEAEALDPAMHAVGMSSAPPATSHSGLGPGRVIANSPHSASARQMAKALTYEVIALALSALSSSTPLVLVFEDMHWADTFTLGLVDYLVRNIGDSPILMVCSYRSDELEKGHPLRAQVAELVRLERVRRIQLSGLQGPELKKLMVGILGHPAEQGFVDLISVRSGGNPFFVEELAAAGADVMSDDLREVVMARVRRLPEPCARVLDVAATIGSRIHHGLLAEVSGLGDDEFDLAADQIVGSHMLEVDDDGNGYRFRHDLVREAVYGSLLPGRRMRLHREVATVLTAFPEFLPNDPGRLAAELASHWWEAQVWNKALPACVSAAAAEAATFAFAEAQLHLERALLAWDRLGDEVASSVVEIDRAALLEQATDAACFAASGRRAMELAQQVVDAIDEQRDPRRKAMAYVRLANNASGDDTRASFAALEAAAGLVPSDEPSFELSRILTEQACGLLMMSRFRESEAVAERALSIARTVGSRSDEGHNTDILGVCRVEAGRFDEGIALVRQSVAIAEEIESAEDLNNSYNNLAYVLDQAGRLEEAAAVTLECLSKGERLSGIRLQGAALNSIESLIHLGRCKEARRLLEEIGDRRGGFKCDKTHLPIVRAILHLRQGRFAATRTELQGLEVLTGDLTELQMRGAFLILRAELALEEGRPADAYHDVERALALAAGTDDQRLTSEICALGTRALADQVEDARQKKRRFDEDKARLLVDELTEKAQAVIDRPRQRGGEPMPMAVAFVTQSRAEATRLSASQAGAWDVSAAKWEELAERHNAAYCRFREAQALLTARSAPARATKSLLQAWQTSIEIGATHLQATIEALAQRARVSLNAETPLARRIAQAAGDLGLTSREVEVLGYLASGQTDGQIAEALFISKKTASVHVSNLLRKLDVDSRYDAAEVGRRYELSAEENHAAGV